MPATVLDPPDLAEKVQAVIHSWRDGRPANAAAALNELDGIDAFPSLIVDLAYEEYCLAEADGAAPSIVSFCDRFGGIRSKLRDVLEGHAILANHPHLLPAAEWPALGDTWNDLDILQELGRGAFARVYLALDPAINRKIVLKLSQRPTREAQSLGSLKHPHIVDVLWSRSLAGYSAVAMPFEGTATVRTAIEALFANGSRPTTGEDILRLAAADEPPQEPRRPLLAPRESYTNSIAMLFERLATALDHAHQQGISHGDLKPANILIAPGGHPILIDFNLASEANDTRWVVGGTLPYMAPERLQLMMKEKAPNTTDWRADVYSFGVVLFEALSGRLPFAHDPTRAPSAAAEFQRRAIGVVAPPDDWPKGLRTLLDDCLANSPQPRPTFAAIAIRLAALHRRPQRRKPFLRAVGLSLAVFASVGVTYQFFFAATPRGQVVEPVTAEEFLARGIRHLDEKKTASAVADFEEAAKLRRDAVAVGWIAIGLARTNQPSSSLAASLEVVDRLNCRDPWALNNLAAALMKSRPRPEGNLRRAVALATELLTRQPDHRAARYNRALANFWLNNRDSIADMEQVLADGPSSGNLCLDAATMYAAGTDDHRTKAIGLARQAIMKGQDKVSVLKSPLLLPYLGKMPAFQNLNSVVLDGLPVEVSDLQFVTPE